VSALYYVPSRILNAFAVGQSEEVAIARIDGLLRHLTLRELAGVLPPKCGAFRL
jgi:heat shock protein HtpX